MTEAKVKSSITNYFKKLQDEGIPIYWDCRQAGGFAYKMGAPDIYVVLNGVHIEIEVKQQHGSRRAMQEKFAERCDKLWNIKYLCSYSLVETKAFIEEEITRQNLRKK